MFVIHSYTEQDAISDGLLVRLAKNIVVTTNLACTLAPDENEEGGFHLGKLWNLLLPKLEAYSTGTYYDEGATDYPDEADAGLAAYLIEGNRVWVMPSYPGSPQVTVMLPEDY